MPARGSKDSTTDTARAGIKEYILVEGLRPGDPLPTESRLVELLGVSRSSVREAIRTLSALDVVEVRHGTGTFVGRLTLRPLVEGLVFRGVLEPGENRKALREVLDVRETLDVSTAETLVACMAGREHPELRRLVAEMEERSARGASFAEADRAFHTQLLDIGGNSLYGQLVAAFWDVHSVVGPSLGVPTPDDIHDTAAAHGRMLDAAEAGDAAAFRAAVTAHYAPLRRVLAQAEEM